MIRLAEIKVGDILTHVGGDGFVVVRVHPTIIAVATVQVSNPAEWERFEGDRRDRRHRHGVVRSVRRPSAPP